MLAQVRVARHKPMPRKVRIDPLDLPVLKRHTGEPVPGDGLDMVLGVPLEIDCAVRRGHPEIDY